MSDSKPLAEKSPWAWLPPVPIENSPVFAWPPRPIRALKYVLGRGFMLSENAAYVGLALVTWFYLSPALERCKTFETTWIAQVYALNLGLVVLLAGGLHLSFYTFSRQGQQRRFDSSESRNSPKFLGGSQLRDNIFWTCVRLFFSGPMPTNCCPASTGTRIQSGSPLCFSY